MADRCLAGSTCTHTCTRRANRARTATGICIWGRQHSHRPSIHTVLPGVLGAVFAVSGLRALILSLPLWNAAGGANHFWSLLFLVTIFALGILMSMSLFGIVLAHTLADRRMTGHVARFSAAATALGSLALGIYWITGL